MSRFDATLLCQPAGTCESMTPKDAHPDFRQLEGMRYSPPQVTQKHHEKGQNGTVVGMGCLQAFSNGVSNISDFTDVRGASEHNLCINGGLPALQ